MQFSRLSPQVIEEIRAEIADESQRHAFREQPPHAPSTPEEGLEWLWDLVNFAAPFIIHELPDRTPSRAERFVL